MLSQADIIAFVATMDAPRAKSFYQDTLGLSLLEDTPFALVFDAHGTMVRIQKVASLVPAAFTVLGWKTKDIAADLERLREAGIEGERYPYFEQDALGVWTAPGGGKVAWFKDPDGNLLSLTEL
ncbi:MAG: Glyoxalase/bleomycin resistance protein/dioxygenase [Myxococcaceae bacterium]|nr:Glyoxalase/bleomycin resistance protein/dioxygenase [Myxococcaceae bacterium]